MKQARYYVSRDRSGRWMVRDREGGEDQRVLTRKDARALMNELNTPTMIPVSEALRTDDEAAP
jgi:hypothetical protein